MLKSYYVERYMYVRAARQPQKYLLWKYAVSSAQIELSVRTTSEKISRVSVSTNGKLLQNIENLQSIEVCSGPNFFLGFRYWRHDKIHRFQVKLKPKEFSDLVSTFESHSIDVSPTNQYPTSRMSSTGSSVARLGCALARPHCLASQSPRGNAVLITAYLQAHSAQSSQDWKWQRLARSADLYLVHTQVGKTVMLTVINGENALHRFNSKNCGIQVLRDGLSIHWKSERRQYQIRLTFDITAATNLIQALAARNEPVSF